MVICLVISYVNYCVIRSTNKRGGSTVLSPGVLLEEPLPGMGLYDPLHGRQSCPELNIFHQGVVKSGPRRGLFRTVLPKLGDKFRTSPLRPSHSLNDSGPVVEVVHALSNPLNYINIYIMC